MNLYYYLDISLELEKGRSYELTEVYFKRHVLQAVHQLFGQVSSSINIDLLKYNPNTRRAIIRVPADYYVKVRSSLTLCGTLENIPCAYRIHKASPLLLALQGDSRGFEH